MRILILAAGPAIGEMPGAPPPQPVWLAETDGELLVQRLTRACEPLQAKLVFAVRSADIRRSRVDSVIALAAPGAAIVPISGETAGAACTALLCVQHIEPEDELLILNANEFLDIDYAAAIAGFRARGLDGGVVAFPSLHPRYSYVRLDTAGHIVEAAEKHPISRMAIPGFYWFRRAGAAFAAMQAMIRKDAQIEGSYYISLALNELVLQGARLGVLPVDRHVYHPLKSSRQVARYEAATGGVAA